MSQDKPVDESRFLDAVNADCDKKAPDLTKTLMCP